MKILKPGKVEQRKFVCECCGCEFIAMESELVFDENIDDEVMPCPQDGCYSYQLWEYGEPYEEPTPTQTDRERMFDLLAGSRFWFEDNAVVLNLIDSGVTFRGGEYEP